MTFSLRLCQQLGDTWNTDDTVLVSEHWWRRFLLSQEKSLAAEKKQLTTGVAKGLTSLPRGTESNGTLEQETGRGRQHANAAR